MEEAIGSVSVEIMSRSPVIIDGNAGRRQWSRQAAWIDVIFDRTALIVTLQGESSGVRWMEPLIHRQEYVGKYMDG